MLMMRLAAFASLWALALLPLFGTSLATGEVVDWREKENFRTIPNCDFYKNNPGSCYTQSHDTPCRYCRAKTFRGSSSADCPGPESFHPEDQGKKAWVLKPMSRVASVRKTFICAVENMPGGAVYQAPQASAASMYGAGGPPTAYQQDGGGSGVLGLSGTAWAVIFGVSMLLVIISVVLCLVLRSNNEDDY